MKWLPLLWSALRRKPGRSIFTLLSIMVAFVLVGSMSGLNAAVAQLIDDARIDRVVVTARYGAWFPLAHVDQINQLDGVRIASSSAFIEASFQEPTNFLFLIMTDPNMPIVWPEAGVSPELFAELEGIRDGMIVTDSSAERFGWSVGDQIPLATDRVYQDGSRDWTFQIAGVIPETDKLQGVVAIGNFTYLNEGRADGRYNDIHRIELLVDDPDDAEEIANSIEALFINSPFPVIAMPERTLIENSLQNTVDIKFFTTAMSAAALFMILLLAGTVLAQSVRERLGEFAVMKTIGFTDNGVFALVLMEVLTLCFVGAGLGLAAAGGLPVLVAMILPGAPVPVITIGVIAFTFGCAALVAILSGLPAAWRVKNISIAEALGGR
nr:MAG: ABC transporter permease [Hyphomicrobiales bacterium]